MSDPAINPTMIKPPTRTRARRAAAVSLLAALAVAAGGCEAFGVGAALFRSDKVPSAYTLPAARTVVIVEDTRDSADARRLARQVEVTATFHLEREAAVPPGMLVDHSAVVKVLDELGPAAARLPVDELGRRLGAEQVIYAQLSDVTLDAAEGVYRPGARAVVRVVRVADGARLFPADAASGLGVTPGGAVVNVEMPYISTTMMDRARVHRLLADEVGLTLARLFFAWSPPQPGEQLNDHRRGPVQ